MKTSLLTTLVTSLSLLATLAGLQAEDWNQYRGPRLDGISKEPILRAWPANGLKQAWRVPLTDGFSSFSAGGGKVYTLVNRAVEGVKRETVVALDAASGKEVWAHPIAVSKFDGGGDSGTQDNGGGDGPRSTPAFADGKVYVYSAGLKLICLNADSGTVAWSRDVVQEHAGRNIHWQNASSPVLDGNLLFVAGGGPGQSLLGIDRKTGTPVWKSQDDLMTHATPVVATIHETRQVIFFTQSGLASLSSKDGKLLWRHKFPYNVSTAASPVVSGDIVYCSAGYGVGSSAARIAKSGESWTATELWRLTGNKICNHWSTPVVLNGHLYGMFSFKEYGKGPLKCVDLATGTEKWAQPGFGPGNLTVVDGQLLALSDAGELVQIQPDPAGYKEVARMKAVQGKCWSTPVVSRGFAFVRSTKEGAALSISPSSASAR